MPFLGGTNDLSVTPERYVVPTGPANIMVVHRNEVILTSGSDLNTTAVSSGSLGNPWPKILGVFARRLFKGAWQASTLRQPAHVMLDGNYGSEGGKVGYYRRGREFGGIGNMPGGNQQMSSHSVPSRPTYNNLVPIVYGLRDVDPRALAQSGDLIQVPTFPVNGVSFDPAQSASLQEVIL